VTGIAFAGAGWLGESLIADLPRVPPLRAVAVQDINLERAHTVARRHAIPWVGDRFEDLLALDGVDAVAICTPNALHAQQAQAALHAGKHVLVQKPLAVSYDSARTTLDVASAVGRLLFVDYTYRFLETMTVLRAALQEPVRAVHCAFHNIYGPGLEKSWFFDPRLSGGGALVDLGVHLLDLVLWLLKPRSATLAGVERGGCGPVEDQATLRLVLDGVPFDLAVSWNAAQPETEIALALDLEQGGRLRWENVAGSFFRFRTVHDDVVLLDRETTLREDTLRAFEAALRNERAPAVDLRVYDILDWAYAWSASLA
jgi:predicted dehydrogenase